MLDRFEFPELPVERERLVMFRTPFPSWTRDRVMSLVEHFKVDGRVQDFGSMYVARDERGVLEIFVASDSVWWTDRTRNGEEEIPPDEMLKEDEAIELAVAFLREKELYEEFARPKSVTYTTVSREENDVKSRMTFASALHVNFEFALDDIPLMGPGAKIQVSYGRGRNLSEVYKFWRHPVKDHDRDIIPAERAAEMLRADPAFGAIEEGRVVFHDVRLAYYALPPREAQGFLIPVYAFRGTASTPALERYDFVKYVVAVEVTPDEIKRAGPLFREGTAIF